MTYLDSFGLSILRFIQKNKTVYIYLLFAFRDLSIEFLTQGVKSVDLEPIEFENREKRKAILYTFCLRNLTHKSSTKSIGMRTPALAEKGQKGR